MSTQPFLSKEKIKALLDTVQDPYSGCPLSQALEGCESTGYQLQLSFRMGYPLSSHQPQLLETLTQVFQPSYPNLKLSLEICSKIKAHTVQKGLKGLPNVKNVIAVASGKGGVGKSTTTVNLALALQAEGAKVGILDADIYGPSQPRMLGIQQRPEVKENKRMIPLVSYELQTMSMGYLVEEEAPMIWRGPMVSSAVQQLIFETEWQNLDYLMVDLPPGTGDIQLTLAQKIPVSGAVIITTPQDIALQDAKKALNMFRKLGIPVLGLIENMSLHICSECGHHDPIFGSNGGIEMAKQYEIPFLGKLPLERSIREQTDKGCPSVVYDPEGPIAGLYREIAKRMAARLSLEPRDYRLAAPTVQVNSGLE